MEWRKKSGVGVGWMCVGGSGKKSNLYSRNASSASLRLGPTRALVVVSRVTHTYIHIHARHKSHLLSILLQTKGDSFLYFFTKVRLDMHKMRKKRNQQCDEKG